jgi:hypothetical protein
LNDVSDEMDINSVWETIGQKIKMSGKEGLGYYELKIRKQWFDEGCSELLILGGV